MPEPSAISQSGSRPLSVLATGDPLCGPASFSRFILPFGYRRIPCPSPTGRRGGHFSPATREDWLHRPGFFDSDGCLDLARRQYLTRETADVLFERARWFTLRGAEKNGAEVRPASIPRGQQDGSYRAALQPPAIVLFEFEHEGETIDRLQTGLLVIEAIFPEPGEGAPSLGDLLQLNEVFRYWRRPYHEHDPSPVIGALFAKWQDLIEDARRESGIKKSEHADYSRYWLSLLRVPFDDGDGSGFHLEPAFGPDPTHPEWAVNGDSRAFVATCAIVAEPDGWKENAAISATPLSPLRVWGKRGHCGKDLGYWIKLLNADGPGDQAGRIHECSHFEREWVAQRTYRRWLRYGTAYGYTDHSMAMLGAPTPNNDPPTWLHFGQMYFDQLLLMLYVRASLFRFSRELSLISARARGHRAGSASDRTTFREKFARLRLDFDLFTNLYQFPLLSTQQQAVEMYSLLRHELDIGALYDEVEREIDGTHEMLELEATQQFTFVATILGVLGILGVFASVVQGAMSLAWFAGDASDGHSTAVKWVLGIALAVFAALCAAICFWRKWLPWSLQRLINSRAKNAK